MSHRASTFSLGGVRIVVISTSIPDPPAALTRAEREVALLVTRGLSNAEIAAARETSERTIANQVRSILRKLDVRSRRGIAAAMGTR